MRATTRTLTGWVSSGLMLAVLLAAGGASAEMSQAAMTAIFKTNQDAVLNITGLVKFMCAHCSKLHEREAHGCGTVVDDSGLMIVSGSHLGLNLADGKVDIRGSSLKATLPAGGEIAMKILLADPDLELAILAPERPASGQAKPFRAVAWDPAVRAGLLDDLLVLGRLDKNMGQQPVAEPGKINAVDQKPRTIYFSNIISRDENAGAPGFTADGRLLGICIGEQILIATGELQDLLDQARQAAAKAASPPSAPPVPAGAGEGMQP
ncbi:MAG: hypothetical protein NTV49_08725 [Kiritimatiellaeota bacterium]|nr:hypothetical protein [Kiritimatiellota bacterium]